MTLRSLDEYHGQEAFYIDKLYPDLRLVTVQGFIFSP